MMKIIYRRDQTTKPIDQPIEVSCIMCKSVISVDFVDIQHQMVDHGQRSFFYAPCPVCKARMNCQESFSNEWERELRIKFNC